MEIGACNQAWYATVAAMAASKAQTGAVRSMADMFTKQAGQLNSWLARLLVGAHLAIIAWLALTNPIYTWDLVPYVATTFSFGTNDVTEIHVGTYDLLRNSLAAAQFDALLGGAYASAMYASPENFASQLSMYEIKPLYVLLIRGLAATGVNPIEAIIWLSMIPGLIICLLLYRWLRDFTGPTQAALTLILFSVGARLYDLSRVPVPDCLSALVVTAGLWCLLVRRWTTAAVVFMCLSIWVRHNNVVFVAPLLLMLCWNHWRRGEPLRSKEFYCYSGGLALAVLSYVLIGAAFDHNWWRLFYHTMIESQININSFAEPFTLRTYFAVLWDAMRRLFGGGIMISTALPFFLLLWLIAWAGQWRSNFLAILRPTERISLGDASILCLPVFLAFLTLFPLTIGLDRFFTPYYAVITLYAVNRVFLQNKIHRWSN